MIWSSASGLFPVGRASQIGSGPYGGEDTLRLQGQEKQ